MRVLKIDPANRLVTVESKRSWFTKDIESFLGRPPVRMATFPNGDGLYVAADCEAREAFVIAGLPPCPGAGVIVGVRGQFGEFRGAKSSAETICALISFRCVTDRTSSDIGDESASFNISRGVVEP